MGRDPIEYSEIHIHALGRVKDVLRLLVPYLPIRCKTTRTVATSFTE